MNRTSAVAALLCLLPLASPAEVGEIEFLPQEEPRGGFSLEGPEALSDWSTTEPCFSTGIPQGCYCVPQGVVFHMRLSREGDILSAARRTPLLLRFLENGDFFRLSRHFCREEKEISAEPFLCRSAAPAADRCVLWRMKVRAPRAGTYRFIGVSDGALAALIRGGVTVLRAGSLLQQPTVATGQSFTVKTGEVMQLDVLVADGDTPQHGTALLLQSIREGVPQKPVLFRLWYTDAPDTSFLPMEVDTDSEPEIWQVIP